MKQFLKKNKDEKRTNSKGFTILELLVVIGVLVILSLIAIYILNPVELLRRSRDVKRQMDLKSIHSTLIYAKTLKPDLFMGSSTVVYISLPDNSSTCSSYSLPPLEGSWQYNCVNQINLQKTDGSGWIPVNLSGIAGISSILSNWPIDPKNSSEGGYYYTYNTGSYKITAILESEKYAELAQKDGGSDAIIYEIGSNLTIGPVLTRGQSGGGSPAAPTVTTNAATNITQNSSRLNGSANPNGSSTTGWFRYSNSNPGSCNDTFGTRTPPSGGEPLGSGSTPVNYYRDISGLSASTTYWFCAIAENPVGKSFGNVLSFTTSAGTATTTIGNGTNPGNTIIGPGDLAVMLNSFTFQTSSGTDNITAVTVTLSAGTFAGIALVEITNDAGSTVYGSVSNPSSNSFSVSLSPVITANTTQTQYKIRITPKTHANMPIPPGAEYSVTGTITDWTGTNTKAGTDTNSATITIDNLSPDNATGVSGTAGDQQVQLNWTNPGGDFSNVVILRRAGAGISDAPAEGSSPNVNDTIGSSIVRYNGSSTTFTDTGLTNGTNYYYKIFTKDIRGNYASGIQTGPHTPNASGCSGTRYWVGGTGNWSDTNRWSTSSGGAGGASVPTASDDVCFDANSFPATGQTMTVDAAATARNINWSLVTNNPTWAGTASLTISGSLTLASGMTRSYTGAITFNATTAGHTITLAGKTLDGNVTFNGAGGGWILQDDFNVGTRTITLTAGSLNTNGKTITAGVFDSNNSNTRTLTLGNSSITVSAAAGWVLTTVTGLTFNAGTSTITMTANSPTFSGGGLTYYNVIFTGSGTITINGANTFNNLTYIGTAAAGNYISFGANQTITGTLTLQGNSQINRLLARSSFMGGARTLTAAAVSLSNVDFQNIAGAGTASPFTGTSLGNCLGNSGITFTPAVTRYWVGNGGNWSDTNRWSTSSGGAGGASVPLCHDTVIFDANSITAAGQTISANMPRLGATIDFSAVANNPTLNFPSVTNGTVIFGSLTLGTLNISGTQTLYFWHRNNSINLTNAGRTFTMPIVIDAPGGVITMMDNFNSNNTLTLTSGTLNANNNNITTTAFISSNTNSRTITMGNGTWTLTGTGTVWNLATITNLTFNANSSTITLTNNSTSGKTFAGGGLTYNSLINNTLGTGALTISGSNIFSSLTINNPPRTVIFTSGTTQTVNGLFTANGTSGNFMTFDPSAAATKWFIAASSTSLSYVSVATSTASGAAAPFACGATCVDRGNNTGWTF